MKAGATAWGNSSTLSPSKNARRSCPPGSIDWYIVVRAVGTSLGSRWIREYHEKSPARGGGQVCQVVDGPSAELHGRVGALRVVYELFNWVDSHCVDPGFGEVGGPVAGAAPDVDYSS